MSIAQGRVGRAVEIFDLMDSPIPPDAMFMARPNVISVRRGWVDAAVQFLIKDGPTHHQITQGLRIPLERWEHLTVDLSDEHPDHSVVVD